MKTISILGWRHDHMKYELENIEQLAEKLALLGHPIYTGAGGGFMYYANRGTYKTNPSLSFGYYLPDFDDELDNSVIPQENIIVCDTYQQRKQLLIEKNILIFCPGGLGTINEFSEAITMKRMGIINPIIICFHKDFWLGFAKGCSSSHKEMKYPHEAINLITDNIQDIYQFIQKYN